MKDLYHLQQRHGLFLHHSKPSIVHLSDLVWNWVEMGLVNDLMMKLKVHRLNFGIGRETILEEKVSIKSFFDLVSNQTNL